MPIPVPAAPVQILRAAFWMPIPVPELPAVPPGAASASLIPVLAVPVLTSGVADSAPPMPSSAYFPPAPTVRERVVMGLGRYRVGVPGIGYPMRVLA